MLGLVAFTASYFKVIHLTSRENNTKTEAELRIVRTAQSTPHAICDMGGRVGAPTVGDTVLVFFCAARHPIAFYMMDNTPAAGTLLPDRKYARIFPEPIQQGRLSLGTSSAYEGRNAAGKRPAKSKGKSRSQSGLLKRTPSFEIATKSHTTEVPQACSGAEANSSKADVVCGPIALADSHSSRPSQATSPQASTTQKTSTSDLDDLSDLTPLSSDVESDTRPSTPDYISNGFESNLSASQARPYASPIKKRKLNEGEKYLTISVKDGRLTSPESQLGNSDADDEMPYYWEVYSSQKKVSPQKIPSGDISTQPKRKGGSKGKRKKRSSMGSEDPRSSNDDEDDEHSLFQIPGELLLAKSAANKLEYWPAKIEEYLKAGQHRGQYLITWLDGSKQVIPRKWFYTTHEDEFSTCKLGKFESVYSEDQDEQAEEERPIFERSPSPEPDNQPLSHTEFSELPIRHQFVYTKNVLKAILDQTYLPAISQHEKFMRGGRHRLSMGHESSSRGLMDPMDVRRVQEYLMEWVLRDEKHGPKLEDCPPEVEVVDVNGLGTNGLDNACSSQPSLNGGSKVAHQMQSPSPAGADGLLSSPPPELPPSSCPTTGVEPESPFVSENATVALETGRAMSVPHSSIAESFALEMEARSDESLMLRPSSLETTSVTVMEQPSTAADGDSSSDLTGREDGSRDPETLTQRPPRQRGSAEFESLDPISKVDYCISVLLPEAVRQILLWRSGTRRSVELLSPEEEQDLYEKGQQLLAERDWVTDIMRLRQISEKQNKKELEQASEEMLRKNGSTSTRSRRKVRPINYREE